MKLERKGIIGGGAVSRRPIIGILGISRRREALKSQYFGSYLSTYYDF